MFTVLIVVISIIYIEMLGTGDSKIAYVLW